MSEEKKLPAKPWQFAPGKSGNPGGVPSQQRLTEKSVTQAYQNFYSVEELIERNEKIWEQAVQMRAVKTMQAWMENTITWFNGGKLPTRHIRVTSKFEDMLAALGSNEPVTIDGESNETQTEN